MTWWTALRHGHFYVSGLGEEAAAVAGPLLPALSAGLTAALVLLLVDLASGVVAACVAVVALLALPGFGAMHSASLTGPPLLALVMVMLGLMMQARRWSLGYGTVAAVAAILVDSAGAGLPIAAVGWAAITARRDGRRPWRRIAFALVPIPIVLGIAQITGGGWAGWDFAWRGGLDTGLRAAGTVIGDQLAPLISSPAVRWFAIADLALVLIAVVVMGARAARRAPPEAATSVLHPATAVLAAGCAAGLAARWLLVPASPAPDVSAVMPLVAVGLVAVATSVALLWPRWPRWGKVVALLVLLGWLQAAIRAP